MGKRGGAWRRGGLCRAPVRAVRLSFFFDSQKKKLTYPNPSSDRKTSHAQINSLRSSLSGEPLVKTLSVTRVLSISPSIVFNRSGGKRPVARPLRARARYVLYISTLVGE